MESRVREDSSETDAAGGLIFFAASTELEYIDLFVLHSSFGYISSSMKLLVNSGVYHSMITGARRLAKRPFCSAITGRRR